MSELLLSARGLRIAFGAAGAEHEVVHGVDFDLAAGRCLALVGESGSGKSVIARSLVGLLGERARVSAEHLQFAGDDLLDLRPAQWQALRGERIGFVLQDALVSLDPLRSLGAEVGDALRLHRRQLGSAERRQRVLAALRRAGINDPEARIDLRSPQLSGGLRQRALIASAIVLEPALLIADEPTTALDASVQAQILELLLELKQRGTAILLISHDLAAVAKVADHIAVMHKGEIVEQGSARQILQAPQSPYTRQLLAAVPHPGRKGQRLSPGPAVASAALAAIARPPAAGGLAGQSATTATAAATPGTPRLRVRNLNKRYPGSAGNSRLAVDDVSFEVPAGATLGIVGESGSGKSSVANIVLGLLDADAGEVELDGRRWAAPGLREAQRRPWRSHMGVVFQDPLSSFDPRWSVAQILSDALAPGSRSGDSALVSRRQALLDAVGLPRTLLERSPRALSGGQRQRVAIARALAHSPTLLVCDEAVSALDVSIQAQILDLLLEIQRELHVSYLFISHDLDVVHHMSQAVVVMRDGVIVERGDADQVLLHPRSDYARRLVASSRSHELQR